MYKVDCYDQNIVITAAAVNLQCACLPVAIYSTCTPDDGWDCHPKHVECNEVKNKLLTSWILLDY